MEKRHENPREGGSQKSNHTSNNTSNRSNNGKRNKKRRGHRKENGSNVLMQSGNINGNVNGVECQQHINTKKSFIPGGVSSAKPDYGNVFWQQPQIQQQQLLAAQSGRLFTAVSDPTVCGYSPMPLTYAMEPVSLPPMYQFYQQVPRPSYRKYRGGARRNHAQVPGGASHAGIKTTSNPINGYSSLQENNFNHTGFGYQNGDYASLPPAANIENGAIDEELSSEHRRYSDPGLGPPQIPTTPESDDSESIDSGSLDTTVGRSSKLVLSLIEQVTALKESNSQLFKELHRTKSELETVKLELNRLKQSNFADYQPGMLSDIVREMREAAKVREESLISKVKSMMSEKHPKEVGDGSKTELDKLKSELERITDEKTETETRLAKVEHELATLKSNANHEGQEIVALEEETLALRRELQEARASRTLAEGHASKCVKAVARSVTPATPVTPVILTISTPCCSIKDNSTILEPEIHKKIDHKSDSSIPKTAENETTDLKSVKKFVKMHEKTNCIEFPTTSSPKVGSVEKFGNDLNSIFDDLIIDSNEREEREIVDESLTSNDNKTVQSFVIDTSSLGSSDRFKKNMNNFEEALRKKLKKSVIPEVAVVSGKSIVIQKKPCSMKILQNSKGLKPPPTKSTYTTAYI